MGKRTYPEIRKSILWVLRDGNPHSYGEIERKAKTNWQTVRNHVQELILFDSATKKEFKRHKQNKRPYVEVTITKEGLELLKKLEPR